MNIDSLREDLRRLDRDLLELVGRRQRLALEIGRHKHVAGLPTRDYGQERDVIQRARVSAESLGVSPDLAEKLLLELIDASLAVQERDSVTRQGGGTGRRALVIGGAGRMGAWMARFLASQGFTVEVADVAGALPGFVHVTDWRASSRDHDVIVVATPLRAANDILREMAASPPPGLVFDVGSLKSPLRPGLTALAAAGARVTSVHPMFGPGTELLSHRHVIFVDLGNPEATREARELFASTMAVPVEMDLDSHDRLIAYVLGVSHALTLAFVTALAGSGETAPRLAGLSSTTFDAQLGIATGVTRENPHLYFEIQSLNDYGVEALETLAGAVERIRDVVSARDEASFVALMERGREYLASRAEAGRG